MFNIQDDTNKKNAEIILMGILMKDGMPEFLIPNLATEPTDMTPHQFYSAIDYIMRNIPK